MHLDTVMTMIDKDKFTIHPSILPTLRLFSLTKKRGKLVIEQEKRKLAELLADALHLDRGNHDPLRRGQRHRCGARTVE